MPAKEKTTIDDIHQYLSEHPGATPIDCSRGLATKLSKLRRIAHRHGTEEDLRFFEGSSKLRGGVLHSASTGKIHVVPSGSPGAAERPRLKEFALTPRLMERLTKEYFAKEDTLPQEQRAEGVSGLIEFALDELERKIREGVKLSLMLRKLRLRQKQETVESVELRDQIAALKRSLASLEQELGQARETVRRLEETVKGLRSTQLARKTEALEAKNNELRTHLEAKDASIQALDQSLTAAKKETTNVRSMLHRANSAWLEQQVELDRFKRELADVRRVHATQKQTAAPMSNDVLRFAEIGRDVERRAHELDLREQDLNQKGATVEAAARLLHASKKDQQSRIEDDMRRLIKEGQDIIASSRATHLPSQSPSGKGRKVSADEMRASENARPPPPGRSASPGLHGRTNELVDYDPSGFQPAPLNPLTKKRHEPWNPDLRRPVVVHKRILMIRDSPPRVIPLGGGEDSSSTIGSSQSRT
jgi:hypothetical protein